MSVISAFRRLRQRMFHREESERTRALMDLIQATAAFQSLSRKASRRLADIVHQRSYKREEFVYYERDPGIGLYIVERGCVRLLAEDESGAVHELRQVSEHGLFGELSLLSDVRRLETAQATTETRLLGFFHPDLQVLTKRHPRVGAEVIAALARYVAEQEVALLQRVGETAGRIEALRMLNGVASVPEYRAD